MGLIYLQDAKNHSCLLILIRLVQEQDLTLHQHSQSIPIFQTEYLAQDFSKDYHHSFYSFQDQHQMHQDQIS
jgi:hypothetical protein